MAAAVNSTPIILRRRTTREEYLVFVVPSGKEGEVAAVVLNTAALRQSRS